jgi:hypothetical protein
MADHMYLGKKNVVLAVWLDSLCLEKRMKKCRLLIYIIVFVELLYCIMDMQIDTQVNQHRFSRATSTSCNET